MTAIRLRGPADVLASLPYQLGYHPEESVVVLALSEGVVGLVERLDLPPPSAVLEAAGSLVLPVLRSDFDAVLLLGFESADRSARPVLDALDSALSEQGVSVVHRLLVRADRWSSLDCGSTCCPPGWQPLPEPASTPAVADFVRLGMVPRGRRADLAEAVRADPALSEAVAAELRRPGAPAPGSAFLGADRRGSDLSELARRLAALSVWADVLGLGTSRGGDEAPLSGDRLARSSARVRIVGPAEVAELVRSLRDVHLRDGLLAWLCPGFLPPSDLDEDLVDALESTLGPISDAPVAPALGDDGAVTGKALLTRLEGLVRAVPDGEAAPLSTVLAYVAWYHGQGTLARVALDRALADAPHYRLAGLVEQLVDLGLRPSALGMAPPPRRHLRAVQFPDADR
ncbi:DUF4192 domain-containing protein [Pedococcus sp.]|jgi:hypothetical protein|uniref:DUF4192 domain-containing protein n=1 Tax=Pedococcus sp. TaxID=2860345 RepID=UPI002E159804|nr:DUF4192 domain-containing protein [Pedococcus sp.]